MPNQQGRPPPATELAVQEDGPDPDPQRRREYKEFLKTHADLAVVMGDSQYASRVLTTLLWQMQGVQRRLTALEASLQDLASRP